MMNSPPTDELLSNGSPLEASAEAIEQLEQLDDIIFPAIDGSKIALQEAGPAWISALTELGPEVVHETRSQYLRYARSTWDFLCRQSVFQPERIIAVLKIIQMLTSDDGS